MVAQPADLGDLKVLSFFSVQHPGIDDLDFTLCPQSHF